MHYKAVGIVFIYGFLQSFIITRNPKNLSMETKFYQKGIFVLIVLFIFIKPFPAFSENQNRLSSESFFSDTITVATFNTWTNAWNQNGRNYIAQTHIRAFQLPISSIQSVLADSPASIRLYFGLDNNVPHLVLVGMDNKGNPQGRFYNASVPCPPTCANMNFFPQGENQGGERNANTITISTFNTWNTNWLNNGQTYMQQTLLTYFKMPLINLQNLNNQKVAAVRFYLGLDKTVNPFAPHLNMVGVNIDGTDALGQIYNESMPCPPSCGQ